MTDTVKPIEVLLVDDHPVVRQGLRAMLESTDGIAVIGEAASGETAIELATDYHPNVVLLDLRMGGMDGSTATRHIKTRSPRSNVIIVTTYDDEADILRAVQAGAAGYLLKGSSQAALIAAVEAASRGETVLSPELATKVFRARQNEKATLTNRECDVLQLVRRGMTNAEIAGELFISEATVKTHLLRTFNKLEVDDRTAAVITALERGFLN